MRILITGGSGLVGSNCMKYLSLNGHHVIGTYFSYKTDNTIYFNSIDLSDPANYKIADLKPEVIIHCGALTNVDLCENDIESSYNNTVVSARNMADLAITYRSKLIYISTDYVFDGVNGPYDEAAEPAPLQVYGRHKLQAEDICKTINDHIIIRVTGIYGEEEREKNFVARLLQWNEGGEEKELKLPVDQFATPINAYDIARAIYKLILNNSTGIYHLAGTDYLNRVQLAQRVNLYYNNPKVKIKPVPTSSLGQAARRPLSSGLKCGKFLTEFPEFQFSNIDDFITKRTNV